MQRPVSRSIRAVGIGILALALLLVAGGRSRSVWSASNVDRSAISFERGGETFWTGSGANPIGWQTFTDGSRAAGNQTVLINLDSQDLDHLTTLSTVVLRSPENFKYRSEMRSNGTAWLGLAFDVQDANNYYLFRVQTGGSTWEVLKYSGGIPATLGSGALNSSGGGCTPGILSVVVPTNAYFTLEARRSPSAPTTIEVWYEGSRQATVTDSSPYSGGKLGLYYRQSPPILANPEVEGDLQVAVRVNVDPATVIRSIQPEMYGTSLAMFGMQNGIPDAIASEADYQTAITKWFNYIPTIIGDLGPTAIRYPGGLQGNNFFWTFGIGPATGRYSYDYSGYGSNLPVGVDEALRFAEELGAATNLIVNIDTMVSYWGESTAIQYAADWVEYANTPNDGSNPNGGTDWAAVRAANGHKAPYGVKVWELGNEVSYALQRPSVYGNRVKNFSQAMKAVDPTIQIGAMDDAFCYYLPYPGYTSLDWYTNGNHDGVLDVAGAYFDFWVSHPYGPSNYFSMVYRGDTCATITKSFPTTGAYSFTFQAGQQYPAQADGPTLSLEIDGATAWMAPVTNELVPPSKDYVEYTASNIPVAAGTHQVSACAARASVNPLYVDTFASVSGPGGYTGSADFQNAQVFYEGMVGTPEAIYTYFGEREGLKGGKPTYLTEWNTVFGTHNAAFDLKSMLTDAAFFESFLAYNMSYANFYPLYGEKETKGISAGQFTGQVEGVAFDDQNGEFGRTDPRPRPSAFFIGLMREYFKGKLVQTRVSPHGYPYGPDTGFTDGGIAGTFTEIPAYVSAYSALSDSGNMLVLAALNKDMNHDLAVDFDLGSFTPYPTATLITLAGSSIGITNEPEDGQALNVYPNVQALNGVASAFTCTLPKHSFVLVLLAKSGSDPYPPDAPSGLAATLNGAAVDLSWNAVSAPDLAGYNVYRTRLGGVSAPIRQRLNTTPLTARTYTDSAVDRGVTYHYAVKAADTDGNESGFSNAQAVPMPGGGPVTTYPSSATITQGTGSSPVANLALADLTTFDVTMQGGATDWNATFDIPQTPEDVKSLAVFFQGKQGVGGAGTWTGQLYLWNYSTSAWEAVVSTSFVKEKFRSLDYGTTTPASLAKFISGTGEVKARIRMTGALSFTTKCDFLGVRTSD